MADRGQPVRDPDRRRLHRVVPGHLEERAVGAVRHRGAVVRPRGQRRRAVRLPDGLAAGRGQGGATLRHLWRVKQKIQIFFSFFFIDGQLALSDFCSMQLRVRSRPTSWRISTSGWPVWGSSCADRGSCPSQPFSPPTPRCWADTFAPEMWTSTTNLPM